MMNYLFVIYLLLLLLFIIIIKLVESYWDGIFGFVA